MGSWKGKEGRDTGPTASHARSLGLGATAGAGSFLMAPIEAGVLVTGPGTDRLAGVLPVGATPTPGMVS